MGLFECSIPAGKGLRLGSTGDHHCPSPDHLRARRSKSVLVGRPL